MRRSEAYRIFPEFKELFKSYRTAKGIEADSEANKAWHALGDAIGKTQKENMLILDKINELQDTYDIIHKDYERHLKHAPKSNRKNAWARWRRSQTELETKLDSIMAAIDSEFASSNIKQRTRALTEIAYYFRFLTEKKGH